MNHPTTDPLRWPPSVQESPAGASHMKTYTAGEDKSRLQAAAKELGLAANEARKPRRQVRRERSQKLHHLPHVVNVLLASSTEDARMRAIYSSHARESEQDRMYRQSWWTLDASVAMEEEPEIIDDGHGPIGGDLVAAVLGIIKGMVGPAILYLPHGFATSGYMVALPMLVICTATFLYSASCLLKAWQHESKPVLGSIMENGTVSLNEKSALLEEPPPPMQQRQQQRRIMLSYPELAYRALGEQGEGLVKTGIALMQSGVCLTYLIFVPQNLHTSFLLLTGWKVPPNVWLLAMILVQIPLSWIRDIRKLTPTNLLANALILYGLLTCIAFALKEAMTPLDYSNAVGDDDAETTTISNATRTIVDPDNEEGPFQSLWDHLTRLPAFADGWFLFIGTSVRV